jgi:predicted AAA+ superfamily ATPase
MQEQIIQQTEAWKQEIQNLVESDPENHAYLRFIKMCDEVLVEEDETKFKVLKKQYENLQKKK